MLSPNENLAGYPPGKWIPSKHHRISESGLPDIILDSQVFERGPRAAFELEVRRSIGEIYVQQLPLRKFGIAIIVCAIQNIETVNVRLLDTLRMCNTMHRRSRMQDCLLYLKLSEEMRPISCVGCSHFSSCRALVKL